MLDPKDFLDGEYPVRDGIYVALPESLDYEVETRYDAGFGDTHRAVREGAGVEPKTKPGGFYV